MNLTKLEIPRRHPRCLEGDHPFNPGDQCFTAISFRSSAWHRQDLCESCWNVLKGRGLPSTVTSYWQTTVPKEKTERTLPKQKEERALVLLKEAVSAHCPARDREAFILALFLARKKQLHLRQEIEQLGEIIYLYESSMTEELIPVKKIALTPSDIGLLQKHIADLLSADA